jgi:hypothetical protein
MVSHRRPAVGRSVHRPRRDGHPWDMTSRSRIDPTTALLAGLVVGVLGSFSDDLLGGSGVVEALQVVLWVASAALLVVAVAAIAGAGGARARQPLRH